MSTRHDTNKAVGARLKRREDPRLLQGRGAYVDDHRRPGMLHVAFVRSESAHAELVSVDVTEARRAPGVLGAYTAADIAGIVKPVYVSSSGPGYNASVSHALAVDRVRYVGEPIAAVVAPTRYEAEDGAELVVVQDRPLDPVNGIEQALSPDAPQLHDTVPGNRYNHFHVVNGDVEGAFAQADFVVEKELRSQRVSPVPLEPRAVLAEWDAASGELTMWCSHQAPHVLRTGLSRFLDLPESRIRVISPTVGGGFGAKLIVYPEDLVVAAIARITRRPVKWTSDRREDLLSTMQGREQRHRVQAAVREDGVILGLRVEIVANNGAHAVWPFTAALDSGQASENVGGPYAFTAYECDVTAVASNKAPMGPYRGVGRVMACFTMERVIEDIAARIGLESLEVRRRNVIRSYPHISASGMEIEEGSSAESIDLMEELLDLPSFRAEQLELREQGVYRGLGLAQILEHNSYGPHEVSKKGIDIVLGAESAWLRVDPDGDITLAVGTHGHGQGHETTFSQVVADEFGISPDRVAVRFGDTAASPHGFGTWASRSLVFAGGACKLAAGEVRDKMVRIAAHHLEADPADVELVDGSFGVKGVPSSRLTFGEVAKIANYQPHRLPDDLEPGLAAARWYRAPDPGTFSNSLHAAIVDVDVDTGIVRIPRYVVIEDCGTIVNPTIVEGQVHGGVAQGLGHALLEHAQYSDEGQPLATTFMDYLLPGFDEVPRMEVHHLETPSPKTLGGFKGMGEGGAINAPAAIANAVTDALSPFGIRIDQTPITPDWIVRTVREARGVTA